MILPLLTLKFSQWTGIVKQYFSELADDNELVSNSANGLLAWLYLDCFWSVSARVKPKHNQELL